jgi:hypothetical protein
LLRASFSITVKPKDGTADAPEDEARWNAMESFRVELDGSEYHVKMG